MPKINYSLIETQISNMLGGGFDFPNELLDELTSSIEVFELKKYDQFLSVGDVCRYWCFVEKGLMRTYYFKKGKDVTKALSQEGTVFSSYDSLFTGMPSNMAIQALEPSVIYAVPKIKIDELCDKYPQAERLYKKILEYYFLSCHHRIESLQFESAEERYENLIDKIPQVLMRVPSFYVASYLSITPETLSRVRTKHRKDDK